MQAKNCTTWAELGSLSSVLTSAVLLVILLSVLFGNSLVIASALRSWRLTESLTNHFIISLAVSDLLLGIFVLPFSTLVEVLHQAWILRYDFCVIWLLVDVWLSTASILNLVIIGFDRYLAICKAMRYRRLMNKRRGKYLVLSVWVLAAIICLPKVYEIKRHHNVTSTFPSYSDTNRNCVCNEWIKCSISGSGTWYVIYSALGSFFLPFAVLIFFYVRIFTKVFRNARQIRRGSLRPKISKSASLCTVPSARPSKGDVGAATGHSKEFSVRVHCGGMRIATGNSRCAISTPAGLPSYTMPRSGSYATPRLGNSPNPSPRCSLNPTMGLPLTTQPSSGPSVSGARLRPPPLNLLPKSVTVDEEDPNCGEVICYPPPELPKTVELPMLVVYGRRLMHKTSQWTLHKREVKAVRMLATVCGAFILCWLPFFTVYPLIGLKVVNTDSESSHSKTVDIVFRVAFWLGYVNSALNPCIYALMSKDFRHAFRDILTRRHNLSRTLLYSMSKRHHVGITGIGNGGRLTTVGTAGETDGVEVNLLS